MPEITRGPCVIVVEGVLFFLCRILAAAVVVVASSKVSCFGRPRKNQRTNERSRQRNVPAGKFHLRGHHTHAFHHFHIYSHIAHLNSRLGVISLDIDLWKCYLDNPQLCTIPFRL